VKLAAVTRSELVESTHYGDAAVADGAGRIIASAGDPERRAYLRSSSKPLQALLVVQTGAADEFEFTDKELAICCASHCGSAEHVQTVLGILAKLGLSEGDLECGVHWPGDADERNQLTAEGKEPGPAHNNCSGKHAGMLAAACIMGVRTAGYRYREHPVQKATLDNMATMCDLPAAQIHLGIDGCGVPTFGMPLRNMCIGFARLTTPGGIPADLASAAERIAAAMAAAPVMVSGRGSFNSTLLELAGDIVTCKGGAEGLFMLGVRGRDMGLGVKIADAGGRAQAPAVLTALRQLGVLTQEQHEKLAEFAHPQVKNCHGEIVGEIRPELVLEFHE